MKGRLLFFFLFSLKAVSTAQDAYPPQSACMDLMRRGLQMEVFDFLTAYGDRQEFRESLPEYLYEAAFWNPHTGVLSSLYDAGADINYRNRFERTPLMAASRHNSPEAVELLLSMGADPRLQDRNGQTALHFAAAYSKEPQVIPFLLENGASLSIKDNKNKTPLEMAILRHRSFAVLEKLMESVPDFNIPAASGETLYSIAMKEEEPVLRSNLIAALFEHGASLRYSNHLGQTPLEEAEEYGYTQIIHELQIYQQQLQEKLFQELLLFSGDEPQYERVRDLLERGADPLVLNEDGLTPCQLAVIGGFPEMLTLLLEYSDTPHPFQVGLEKFNRHLPFFALTHPPEKALDLMDMLLDWGYSPDAVDPEGNPLLTESLYNSLAVTERLLQAGANTEIRDNFGATPLMRAGALENAADAMSLLNHYGADPNAMDYDSWSVLYYTVLFGRDMTAIQILLDHGARLNEKDNYGSSVMLWAAAYLSDPEILNFLAAQGVSLTDRDKDGWIPLMAALNWANTPEAVEYLMRNTPDGRVEDGIGRSLEDLARVYEEKTGNPIPEAMEGLSRRRLYPPDSIPVTDLNASLHETAEWGENPGMIARLTGAGGDINSRDENGWTPLMKAAAFNDSAMVEAVLQAGGEPLYQTGWGWTALHVSSWSDDTETVSLLLQAGLPVDVQDRDGWTPFLWSARNQAPAASVRLLLEAGADSRTLSLNNESALFLLSSGWRVPDAELLDLLLRSGGDPNLSNAAGITPLMKAAYLGYAEAVQTLLEAGADPLVVDTNGNRAEDYAQSGEFEEIVDLLESFIRTLP